jgi:RND family efflux transporter MFP subunit
MKTISSVLAWLATATILILGFAWLAGWFNDRTVPGEETWRADADIDRQTVEVTAREVDTLLPVPGRLWAEKRTRISSEIVGKIVDVAVAAGDHVDPGDTLLRLDQAELLAGVNRIRERLPAQRVRIEEAQAEFDRDRQLVKEAVVAPEQVETSRRLLAEAQANLGATEQQLKEAEARLKETVIKATMSGIVVDRLRKVGEVASPGEPLLEIYQPTSLRLECFVPESLTGNLRIGQKLQAELGPSLENTTVTIDEIVPQADASSRTVLVKARIPEATQRIEGQYGRLLVPLDREEKIFIPEAAVQSLGQLDFVAVVTEDRGIEQRFIKRGRPLPSKEIEILSGLNPGERVVLATDTRPSSRSTKQ